ncbi:MAG: IS1595 family transposase [Alphaproteobacteria bacterium]|nr:IS1595 family transposase [Alphaproteobacteria bacterium]MBV9694102.1 IS1595 family transposase [Alphaproteobacteria bacterium]
MGTSKRIHQMTVPQWEKAFPDDDSCKAYLVKHRWPEGIHCPRCGNTEIYELARAFHWQCTACAPGGSTGYRFSVTVGTIFENSNVGLRMWFRVIHRMLVSKKGVSAHQIYREMGFGSYRTAWYMCHRIRVALADENFRKLIGIVEVDETYIGGHNKNRHWNKKTAGVGGLEADKSVVIGAVQRKGNVVARVIENTKTETFEDFVREFVSTDVSLLATDEHSGYRRLSPEYPHHAVRHQAKNYVVGAIHTNTIEGFWSIIKRGVVGTFHKVSRKYLPLYVAEFQFRYNNRENPDIFASAIEGC